MADSEKKTVGTRLRSVGSGIKTGFHKVRDHARSQKTAWDNFINKVNSHPKGPNTKIYIFLILAIIFYELDLLAFGGLSFGTPNGVVIGCYAALLILGHLIFQARVFSSKSWEIFTLTIISIALPRLVTYLTEYTGYFFGSISHILTGVLIISPPWFIYSLFSTDADFTTPGLQKFGTWYLIFIVVVALYLFLTKSGVANTSIVPPEADVQGGFEFLKLYFFVYPQEMIKSIFELPGTIRRTINQTLGLNYFTGQVEQNKDKPLGVYLEDLRPTEPIFFEGNPVVVWATLRGKSFEGDITVTNGCYAVKGQELYTGSVYPYKVNLFYDESTTLECVFETLPEGRYTVKFTADFDFPTWGYVTYTYVDRDVLKSYYSQGKNINMELNIPRKSETIFTNGPAGIGTPSLDMPYGVEVDNPYLPSFGATLYNVWPQGEIVSINTMEIMVPKGIVFDSCTPAWNSVVHSDMYDTYKFSPNFSSGTQFFTTVTCRPHIANVNSFLGTNLKVLKTYAVNSVYKYTMEESVLIRVEKIG